MYQMMGLLLGWRLGTQHPGPVTQPGLGMKVRSSGYLSSPEPAALLHPQAPQATNGRKLAAQ